MLQEFPPVDYASAAAIGIAAAVAALMASGQMPAQVPGQMPRARRSSVLRARGDE